MDKHMPCSVVIIDVFKVATAQMRGLHTLSMMGRHNTPPCTLWHTWCQRGRHQIAKLETRTALHEDQPIISLVQGLHIMQVRSVDAAAASLPFLRVWSQAALMRFHAGTMTVFLPTALLQDRPCMAHRSRYQHQSQTILYCLAFDISVRMFVTNCCN